MKIALLFFLELTILSSNPKKIVSQEYMSMVDDLETFNSYPWGTVSSGITIEQLWSKDFRAKYDHFLEHQCQTGKEKQETYTLYGFPFGFMVSKI